MEKNIETKSPSIFTQGIVIALVFLLLFFSGNLIGTLGAKPTADIAESTQDVAVVTPSAESSTQASSVADTTVTATTTTIAPTDYTAEPTQQTTVTEDSSSDAPTSKAEIIALFNESANKIKTDAVKVVKNYEYRTHNEEHLVMPSVLESTANSLMSTAMQDDLEPIVYETREDIVANYQVPGQDWVSQLTEAEVAEATCTDNGTEYEIMLKLHPTVDPEPGIGVAKAFDTITASDVKESAPSMLQSFSTEYYDCVVRCKIDKATGRTTWANYTSPLILKVVAKIVVTMDAQIGLCFEKDYTITY